MADEIDEAQHSSQTAKEFPFTIDLGTKNPDGAGYWASKGWSFCDPNRLEAWHLIRNATPSIAIDDIGQVGIGNDEPEYRVRMSGSYVRDASVRNLVLGRAAGRCEECGQPGFMTSGGSLYLETHHVISLSEQGPDKPHNVIALCANDHRRAHFGKDWADLQDKFLSMLRKYKTES